MKTRFFAAVATLLCYSLTAHAQQQDEAILAINEGVTYHAAGTPSERYKPLLDMLSKELKRPVQLKVINRYSEFDRDLAQGKYHFAFIHPAHIGLQAVMRGNYYGVASAKGFTGYRVHIMVAKDSPLQSIDQLKGKKIGVPSLESITTAMLVAHLRGMNITEPEKHFMATRYQDAVPFMIENGFVEAGATASGAIARAWTEDGGRILGTTEPVPIKQFLISSKIDPVIRSRIQMLLLSLSETLTGKAALDGIGVPGFVAWDEKVMREASNRLGSIRLGL